MKMPAAPCAVLVSRLLQGRTRRRAALAARRGQGRSTDGLANHLCQFLQFPSRITHAPRALPSVSQLPSAMASAVGAPRLSISCSLARRHVFSRPALAVPATERCLPRLRAGHRGQLTSSRAPVAISSTALDYRGIQLCRLTSSLRRPAARPALATRAAAATGGAAPAVGGTPPARLLERGVLLSLALGLTAVAGVSWRDILFGIGFPVYLWAINKYRFNDNAAAREAAATNPDLPMTLAEGATAPDRLSGANLGGPRQPPRPAPPPPPESLFRNATAAVPPPFRTRPDASVSPAPPRPNRRPPRPHRGRRRARAVVRLLPPRLRPRDCSFPARQPRPRPARARAGRGPLHRRGRRARAVAAAHAALHGGDHLRAGEGLLARHPAPAEPRRARPPCASGRAGGPHLAPALARSAAAASPRGSAPCSSLSPLSASGSAQPPMMRTETAGNQRIIVSFLPPPPPPAAPAQLGSTPSASSRSSSGSSRQSRPSRRGWTSPRGPPRWRRGRESSLDEAAGEKRAHAHRPERTARLPPAPADRLLLLVLPPRARQPDPLGREPVWVFAAEAAPVLH